MARAGKSKKCANPLFEKWLEEWRQIAIARDSPTAIGFGKALESLRKYPLPLTSGRDCVILKYFGRKVCAMLDKKLEQHKKQSHVTTSIPANTVSVSKIRPKRLFASHEVEPKKRKVEENIPLPNSVVEIDLCDDSEEDTEKEPTNTKITNLKRKERKDSTGSPSSNEAFKKFCEENAEPIITVKKKSHFIFSETVDSLSKILDSSSKVVAEKDGKEKNVPDIQKNKTKESKTNKQSTSKAVSQKKKDVPLEDQQYESFFLLPNNFDVVLLVDTQETSGGKTKPRDDETISKLSETGVLFEVRSLKIGDFAWVARCRFTNKELVLPYIVERKRIDDLSASIVDGRYKEQKFRLKKSGIQHVIYMIEDFSKNYHGSIPLSSLQQASVNCAIQDGFIVKFTSDHQHSMEYLASLTETINENYESKELWSCKKKDVKSHNFDITKNSILSLMEFKEFNEAAKKTKNFNIREMFMRQLLQLKGVSVNKAIAITNLYPTPKLLSDAFKSGDENLLAKITFGSSSTKIGPVMSKTLYQFYTKYNF